MKRISVKKTKRGFTLLEVMLAVAILVIGSTMMINGFMATMNYSTNTSVYARSASENYSSAINQIALYSGMTKEDAYKVIPDIAMAKNDDGKITGATYGIKFQQGVAGVNLDNIAITEFKQNGIDAAKYKTNVGSKDYTESYGDPDSTYSNNRTSFYYVPEFNNAPGATKGSVKIIKRSISGTQYELWWKDTATGKDIMKIGTYNK